MTVYGARRESATNAAWAHGSVPGTKQLHCLGLLLHLQLRELVVPERDGVHQGSLVHRPRQLGGGADRDHPISCSLTRPFLMSLV